MFIESKFPFEKSAVRSAMYSMVDLTAPDFCSGAEL
jgi:hypothetical protein